MACAMQKTQDDTRKSGQNQGNKMNSIIYYFLQSYYFIFIFFYQNHITQ